MRYDSDAIVAKANADALLRGYLVAWNPVTQKKVWQVRHDKVSNGGVLSTAGGLVFQGTGDGAFNAYAAESGKKLWGFQTETAVLAAPISYRVDGEQYIPVNQGGGGTVMVALGKSQKTSVGNPNRLLVFKLQDSPQAQQNFVLPSEPELPHIKAAKLEVEGLLDKGEKLYERNCTGCHGISVEGSGVVPDLRYMDETTHRDFQAIVLAGLKAHQGMVGFYETLSPEDVDAIHVYVISRNQALLESSEWSYWDHIRYWFWYFIAWLGDKYPWLANATLQAT